MPINLVFYHLSLVFSNFFNFINLADDDGDGEKRFVGLRQDALQAKKGRLKEVFQPAGKFGGLTTEMSRTSSTAPRCEYNN